MLLFFKSFIVGLGKIIPGVSGAMLAINFGIYEKLINAITNFFSDWKGNIIYIVTSLSGIILAIILFSDIILFLISNYKALTMTFFLGLICGSTYNFYKICNFSYRLYIISFIVVILFIVINIISFSYKTSGNSFNNLTFFIGGVVEILASIIPGISATSLLMIMGIYDDVLLLVASSSNFSYVFNHLNIYFSYFLGMITSLVTSLSLINYVLKNYRDISYAVILGLSMGSILFLIVTIFNIKFLFWDIIFGILLFLFGVKLSNVCN